ncbi:Asparaginase/glutaminase [Aspergillus varians]
MTNDTLLSAVENGAKGVVFAGSGAGSVNTVVSTAVSTLVTEKHFPIVQSTRTGNGEVPYSDSDGISSGFLSPPKARILLGLLLAKGQGVEEIREVFGKVGV